MFHCNDCSGEFSIWSAQCPTCGRWDTFVYREPPPAEQARAHPVITRFATGLDALDDVAGGGLVSGAFYLIGGDPGAGKSTLLLQVALEFSRWRRVLYATSEETLKMLEDRAFRLHDAANAINFVATDSLDDLLEDAPGYHLFVDSLTMMRTGTLASAAGSPTQLKACAHALMRFGREHGKAVIAIGQVTKEGSYAGPNMVAHLADCLLYLELIGRDESRRLSCRQKNRYGPSNVARILQMDAAGLHDVEETRIPVFQDTGNEKIDSGDLKE